MSTPAPRKARRARTPRPSPAEDGELRETLQDVLDRNKAKTPITRGLIKRLYEHQDVLTPGAAAVTGRLLSAWWEPAPTKMSPEPAKNAAFHMVGQVLPERKVAKKAAEAAADAEEAQRQQAEMDRKHGPAGRKRKAERAAIGGRSGRESMDSYKDNLGRRVFVEPVSGF